MELSKKQFRILPAALSCAAAFLLLACEPQTTRPAQESVQSPNQVVGTWRPVAAQIDPDGKNQPAYGPDPQGLLVFTDNLRYLEVLHDPRIPTFKSSVRGEGTPAENQAAMAGSIAFYGRYTVDAQGEFSGNQVEGSTFPNWIGDVRTRAQLQMVVQGDTMRENFQRPDGTRIQIVWVRAR